MSYMCLWILMKKKTEQSKLTDSTCSLCSPKLYKCHYYYVTVINNILDETRYEQFYFFNKNMETHSRVGIPKGF